LNDIDVNEIYSVSELNYQVRELIEENFPSIWVEGEISNFARPASGHIYFSLKDEAAQVRCAMFRTNNRTLKFKPENGMQVLARARVSLYEARGDYQLIVDYMEEAGDGLLRRKFEQLKAKLAEQGMFDSEHKRDIPALPTRIGIITSPTGAALHDVLSVLERRFPAIPVVIYPIPVQGNDAPPQIVSMINKACQRQECDVFILTRGGGSLEDLWAFNDERVAKAIFKCTIPIVCGVGHEIDFTIADFVADVRAPTPSAAAELVSPDQAEWLNSFVGYENRLRLRMSQQLSYLKQQYSWLTKRIQHPLQRIQRLSQRVDEVEQRLIHIQHNLHQSKHAQWMALSARLQQRNPIHRLQNLSLTQQTLSRRLNAAISSRLHTAKLRLSSLNRAFEAVSPKATLGRGYAIVTLGSGGPVVRDAKSLKPGEELLTRLQHGQVQSTVITSFSESDDIAINSDKNATVR